MYVGDQHASREHNTFNNKLPLNVTNKCLLQVTWLQRKTERELKSD